MNEANWIYFSFSHSSLYTIRTHVNTHAHTHTHAIYNLCSGLGVFAIVEVGAVAIAVAVIILLRKNKAIILF